MRNLRPAAASAAIAVVLALSACFPVTPSPAPSHTSSATPEASPTPTHAVDDEPVAAALLVMTGSTLSVFGVDGTTLFATDYEAAAAGVAAQLAEALDVDPVITSTAAVGSGCDSDQTTYEFGGLLMRSPGYIGSTGAYEIVVTSPAVGGVAVETIAGQRIGATRTAFAAAVGETVLVSDQSDWVTLGFDIVNPEADEYEQIGAVADFHSGALVSLHAPYYFYADC